MNAWSGVEVFGNISSLRSIRLDFNYINVVKESFFPESLIANLAMVNMAFNPFCCHCQNLWFRKWIDERPTLFSNYPKSYTCKNPPIPPILYLRHNTPQSQNTSNYHHCLWEYNCYDLFDRDISSTDCYEWHRENI
jgi:hypothetical protein